MIDLSKIAQGMTKGVLEAGDKAKNAAKAGYEKTKNAGEMASEFSSNIFESIKNSATEKLQAGYEKTKN